MIRRLDSIRTKLLAGFLSVAAIGALVGAIALVALDRVGAATSRLVRDELPIAKGTERAQVAALNVVGGVRLFLASRQGLSDRRGDVTRDQRTLSAAVDALGTAIADAGRDDLVQAVGQLREEQRRLGEAGVAVMEVHERLSAYGFTFDERFYTVVTFGHYLRAQLARWISDLGDAARFDSPFKHPLDPAATPFERWRAQYVAVDAELGKLIDAYSRTNTAIHSDARRILEAEGGSARGSHFERARARNLARAERELEAIIEHASRTSLALEQETMTRLTALDATVARLGTNLSALSDSVRDRVQRVSNDTVGLVRTSHVVGSISVLAGVALSLLIAVLSGRGLARPLAALRGTMERLTRGDLDAEVPGCTRGDELGAMARSVEVLKQSALERQRLSDTAAREQELRLVRARRIEEISAQFETAASGDVGIATEAAELLRKVAGDLTTSATQTNDLVATASGATAGASAEAATIAAAISEFSASIRSISDSIGQSTTVVRQAVGEVTHATDTFGALSASAERIGEVVKLINSIAAQTNLLALNATIEAARAGDAGRGFAVVAGEVKNLAAQTAQATDDIASQVAAIQQATANSIAAMAATGRTIARLDAISAEISASVTQQGQSTASLAQSTNAAASSVDAASQSVDGVKARAQSTHDLAGSMLASVDRLRRCAHDLGHRIATFTTQIKAA
ncbi:MAG: HAMP domain-containing protein [Alphaproteobacteria bacterium]|nr:HAMP domain-containing protein [Alphaproteobacteria bacterium]